MTSSELIERLMEENTVLKNNLAAAREVVEAARVALRVLDSKQPKEYSRGFSTGKHADAGDVLEEALKRNDEGVKG